MAGFRFSNPSVEFVPPAGQEEWTSNAGSFTWVVPNGVYGISAVCIGGGGGGAGGSTSIGISGGGGGSLTWGNNIPVTPGEQLSIVVGSGGSPAILADVGGNGSETYIARGATRLIAASGGGGGLRGNGLNTGQVGGSYTAQSGATYGGGTGGRGTTLITTPTAPRPTGGGGAGGYSGVGGDGGNAASISGSSGVGGGGGGGAGGTTGNVCAAGGGGVLPYGEGSSGAAGAGVGNFSGTGGSGGFPTTSLTGYTNRNQLGIWSPPQFSIAGQNGGEFGGGGGGSPATAAGGICGGFGARGCVRIIWGNGRSFPSTNTTDYNDTTLTPSGQSNYTTAGTQTFTVPANVRYIGAVCIGGGGGGGQGLAQTNSSSSGGGGALTWANFPVTPGESFTVVIGVAGQSTGTATQTAGGASHITRNVSFKGFISGTNLFITEVVSGIITTGIAITGAGVTPTTISTFVTGEYGKTGTYTIGASQTVGTLESTITFSGTIEVMRAGGGNVGGPSSAPIAGASGGTRTYSTGVLPNSLMRGGGNGGGSNSGSTASTIVGGAGGAAGGWMGNGPSSLRGAPSTGASNGIYPTPFMSGAPCSGEGGSSSRVAGGGGGGVGIYGQGPDGGYLVRSGNGTQLAAASPGYGGSGGTNGAARAGNGNGGNFGGGGGGQGNAYVGGNCNGGGGAVRFVWGKGRTYPQYVPDI